MMKPAVTAGVLDRRTDDTHVVTASAPDRSTDDTAEDK